MGQLKWVYMLLVGIRIAFALSPGYIHPDEWFQFGEILAGDLLGIETLRTWEFDPDYPCRSMASIRLFGLPFHLLGKAPSTYALFVASRAVHLSLSFLLDWSAWHLLPRHKQWKGITLLAFSGSVMAFSVRSFSNNVEASLLAVSLVCLLKFQQDSNTSFWSLILGTVSSVGFFSRFTYVIFAAPIYFAYLQIAWKRHNGLKAFVKAMIPVILAAASTASLHIIYDSIYFTLYPHSLVFTPLNAALYNTKRENLALHGTHPRWLHIVVNAPMMLGVGPWIYFALNTARLIFTPPQDGKVGINKVLQQTISFSIACLSLQPHQEPRFLLPLVMPATILFASSSLSESRIMIWILTAQSIATAIFFSLLHQAGTIPAMLDVSSQISMSNASIEAFFWRSFMPPRHLLNSATDPGKTKVNDCHSMSVDEIISRIQESSQRESILFAPSWVLHEENRAAFSKVGYSLVPMTPSFMHVDTDHIEESVARYYETGTLLDSFSYRAYSVSV